jgi:hypothetical protein
MQNMRLISNPYQNVAKFSNKVTKPKLLITIIS